MKIYLEYDSLNQSQGIIPARINEGVNQVNLIDVGLASRDELSRVASGQADNDVFSLLD